MGITNVEDYHRVLKYFPPMEEPSFESKEMMDNTGVHPESYAAARGLIARFGYTDEELIKPGEDVNEIMDSPEVHM